MPLTPRFSALVPLAILVGCAATGSDGVRELATPAERRSARLVLPPQREEALGVILRLEDARQDGGGLLQSLAAGGEARVRERALVALGRLALDSSEPAVTQVLERGLSDSEPAVRRAAAFGLGLRGDSSAVDALLSHREDPDPLVRAALVEALGKLDDPRIVQQVLDALDDPIREVRIEAALAPHRWDPAGPRANEIDEALIRVAKKHPLDSGHYVQAFGLRYPEDGQAEDVEVIWRAIFSLQRRRCERARDVFGAFARTPETPLARLFAVKGLARLEPQEGDGSREILESCLGDADWRLVFEALVGLESFADEKMLATLQSLRGHASVHVRAAACSALGRFLGNTLDTGETVEALLDEASRDSSVSVRAAAIRARALLLGDAFARELEILAADENAVLRKAAANAAATLTPDRALPLLLRLSRDTHPGVAGGAIEGLGRFDRPDARRRLHALLSHPDSGRRLAAVLALHESSRPDDLPYLRAAFESLAGENHEEVRVEVLKNAQRIGTPNAVQLLRDARYDDARHVRRVALELLGETGPPELPTQLVDPDPLLLVALGTPLVEIETNRGLLVFELFPDEAPLHVRNFLELARRDHYDDLTFPRVVPDFVVQGGCHRGDGNGTTTFDGRGLRHEIGPRKYVRGSLGMPRSEDLESGGSQIFICHRPTPHLDGLYTVFGELREGFEVLDALEVGDRILDVRLP